MIIKTSVPYPEQTLFCLDFCVISTIRKQHQLYLLLVIEHSVITDLYAHLLGEAAVI